MNHLSDMVHRLAGIFSDPGWLKLRDSFSDTAQERLKDQTATRKRPSRHWFTFRMRLGGIGTKVLLRSFGGSQKSGRFRSGTV